jgi:hypothetical protein
MINDTNTELTFWRAASALTPDRAAAAAITLLARAVMDLAGWHEEDDRRQAVGAAVDTITDEIRKGWQVSHDPVL